MQQSYLLQAVTLPITDFSGLAFLTNIDYSLWEISQCKHLETH